MGAAGVWHVQGWGGNTGPVSTTLKVPLGVAVARGPGDSTKSRVSVTPGVGWQWASGSGMAKLCRAWLWGRVAGTQGRDSRRC